MKFGNTGELPTIVYGAHLITALWKIGPTSKDGSPVAWSEIESYARMSRTQLSGWDAETIHAMSEAYAIYAIKARSNDCPSPWKMTHESAEVVNAKIRAFFGPRKKKPATTDTGSAQRIPKQKRS